MKAKGVNQLGWAELNSALMTANEAMLARWLKVTVASGSLYRSLRVHGRLNAARKEREIAEIKAACVKAAPAEVEEAA